MSGYCSGSGVILAMGVLIESKDGSSSPIQPSKTDEDILLEVVKIWFDRDTIIESLRNRVQNEGTVAYCLLLGNMFRNSSGYLGAELLKPMDGFNLNEGVDAIMSPCLSAYMDYQGISIRSQVERKWALGLQSRAHPREIMTKVLKALQELNVCWKMIGHYNMKCRWAPCMMNNSMQSNHYFGDELTIVETDTALTSPNMVKFEVQWNDRGLDS